MNSESSAERSLREMEMEVEAEGREWMRKRLEAKLQNEIEQHGAIFPPKQKKGSSSASRKDDAAHRLRRGGAKRVAGKKSR